MEHQSRGRALDRAGLQAGDYFPGLKDHELSKYILVSNFARFPLYDLNESTEHKFGLAELPQHQPLFAFLTGYQKREYRPEDPASIRAAELMGELYDALLAGGDQGYKLEVLLVRILLCLFAEDTAIWLWPWCGPTPPSIGPWTCATVRPPLPPSWRGWSFCSPLIVACRLRCYRPRPRPASAPNPSHSRRGTPPTFSCNRP